MPALIPATPTRNTAEFRPNKMQIIAAIFTLILAYRAQFWIQWIVLYLVFEFNEWNIDLCKWKKFYMIQITIIIIIIIITRHINSKELNWIELLETWICVNEMIIIIIIIILFVCLFVCLLVGINVFLLQCLPLISPWLYVVFVPNVITCIYTVLCL
jgi:hypothetical protein